MYKKQKSNNNTMDAIRSDAIWMSKCAVIVFNVSNLTRAVWSFKKLIGDNRTFSLKVPLFNSLTKAS